MSIKIIYLLVKRLGLLPYFANTFCQLRDGTVTTIRNFHLVFDNGRKEPGRLFVGEPNDYVRASFNNKTISFYVSINDFGDKNKEVVKIFANREYRIYDLDNIVDIIREQDTI